MLSMNRLSCLPPPVMRSGLPLPSNTEPMRFISAPTASA